MWLVQSPGTAYHCTFVLHLHYQHSKTCSRHIFSHVLTSLTNCFAEYEQRTLYGALVFTRAMWLRIINYRFIIIIIIIIIVVVVVVVVVVTGMGETKGSQRQTVFTDESGIKWHIGVVSGRKAGLSDVQSSCEMKHRRLCFGVGEWSLERMRCAAIHRNLLQ